MVGRTDWYDWHSPYADHDSPLSRRLRLVQRHIAAWLDERPDPAVTVLSVCAGQGKDVLEVLAARSDASRVRCHLLEYDRRNAAVARAKIRDAALTGVTVHEVDAGRLASYVGVVPADLVLLVGVFGNITDADIRTTVDVLPRLCSAGATVIWTRTREAPDLTPAVRGWFADAAFREIAFHAPDDVLFSVGVHEFGGRPKPLEPNGTVFRFVR